MGYELYSIYYYIMHAVNLVYIFYRKYLNFFKIYRFILIDRNVSVMSLIRIVHIHESGWSGEFVSRCL